MDEVETILTIKRVSMFDVDKMRGDVLQYMIDHQINSYALCRLIKIAEPTLNNFLYARREQRATILLRIAQFLQLSAKDEQLERQIKEPASISFARKMIAEWEDNQ